MPTKEDLLATHASYDRELWADYEALYKGGRALRARMHRFLPQNPQEPEAVYAARLRAAHYRCYLGSIVDYFAAYLVTAPMVVRAKDEDGAVVDPDKFYARFKEDCDARDNDVMLFMRRRVTEALQKKRSWWLVELPATERAEGEQPPRDRAEWEALGLGEAHLCALDAEQVLDWDADDHGALNWARIYSRSERRLSPISKTVTVTERWEVFDRANVTIYQRSYPKDAPPADTEEVPRVGAPRPHGFARVPLLCIDLDDGLWLANRLESPQTENLQLTSALTWAIRRTCYAMPVLNLEDGAKDPVMGAGYFLKLGLQEKFGWSAPPATPFSEIRDTVKDAKDEIYRIIHAMALGVNNNAAAVGRSAESKVADSEVVRVILTALGGVVREALERTYALLSEGRDEAYEWAIEGLDQFDEIDAAPLIDAIASALLLDIPSRTFHVEAKTRAAMACLPSSSQDVKDRIKEEIEENERDPMEVRAEQQQERELELAANAAAAGDTNGEPRGAGPRGAAAAGAGARPASAAA
jgi:hypothetical protein